MPQLAIGLADGLGAVLVFCLLARYFARPRKSLPPGPKGLPLIGNALQWPKTKEWLTFSEWGARYGSLVHVNLLGTHVVIVNSPLAAFEMLDRKGSVYSGRPHKGVTAELSTMSLTITSTQYGDRLRKLRSMLTQSFGSKAALDRYTDLLERNSRLFVKRIMEGRGSDSPVALQRTINLSVAANVLDIAYGYQVKEGRDDMVDVAVAAMEAFAGYAKAGVFLVDVIPMLRYLPEWFPGTSFHQVTKNVRLKFSAMRQRPMQYVRAQLDAGTAPQSFAEEHLTDLKATPESIALTEHAAAAIFGAGYDTSASALHTFFLAMTLYPDVQRRAQAELDAVVGPDRLPVLRDRESLPYVNALIKEVLRWQPIVPQGVPHLNTEDDVQDGYLIPKGTIIVPNVWAFLHDPQLYSNSKEFNPSRFIANDVRTAERDPTEFVFGFGRRICPGRHFAETSLFLSIAASLALFDIAKAKDAAGAEIEPIVDYSSGLLSHARPFSHSIRSRSLHAEALVRE